jgi:hypothetical protein
MHSAAGQRDALHRSDTITYPSVVLSRREARGASALRCVVWYCDVLRSAVERCGVQRDRCVAEQYDAERRIAVRHSALRGDATRSEAARYVA